MAEAHSDELSDAIERAVDGKATEEDRALLAEQAAGLEDEIGRKVDEEEPVDATGYDIPGAQEKPEVGTPENPYEAMTAFLVVIDKNGMARATSNVNLFMALDRPATIDDMFRGCAEVSKDIQVEQAGAAAMNAMQSMARAAQQQMAAQMQSAKMQQVLKDRGIRTDGKDVPVPPGVPLLG